GKSASAKVNVLFATPVVANPTIFQERPDLNAVFSAEKEGDQRLVQVGQVAFAVAVEAGDRESGDRFAERTLELLHRDLDAAVRAVEQDADRRRLAELCRRLRERRRRVADQVGAAQ